MFRLVSPSTISTVLSKRSLSAVPTHKVALNGISVQLPRPPVTAYFNGMSGRWSEKWPNAKTIRQVPVEDKSNITKDDALYEQIQ